MRSRGETSRVDSASLQLWFCRVDCRVGLSLRLLSALAVLLWGGGGVGRGTILFDFRPCCAVSG